MGFTDWFKKAKDAKAEKKEPPKNEYGNQGAGQGSYKDAQAELDAEEARLKGQGGKQVADGD